MAPMRCNEFWQFSSEWMEGQRKPAAVSHLADCPGCRALIADLEIIRRASALLPEEEPPARIWSALKSQLEKEGLIRAPKTAWRERFVGFGAFRPAMAGAYLSIIIAGAVLLGGHLRTNSRAEQRAVWLQSSQKNIMPVGAELSNAESKSLPMLKAQDNDVTATLNRNLAIVDNMISICEKGVRQDPQNEMMRDYLYTAYQQKADLLATVADSEGR